VTAVDVDERVVCDINQRRSKIEEIEDFERFFRDPDVQANLAAHGSPPEADAFVIAVPTPVNHGDNTPDLCAVTAAVESIVPRLHPGNLVVVESTVPAGTTRQLIKPLIEQCGYAVGEEVFLAHCPERILPGNVMAEAVYNARVIGGVTQRSAELAAELYGSFVKGKLCLTDDRTAELVKLVENTYRDVNIAIRVLDELDQHGGPVIRQ